MSLIDTVKRINIEEFKQEDREVAERIGNVYNYFAEQVTNTINGNLDFDNLNRSIITLSVATDENGNPTLNTQFAADVGILGISVIKAVNATNRVNYVNGQPFISFTSSGDGLYTIDNIKGLITGNQYNLTIELVF